MKLNRNQLNKLLGFLDPLPVSVKLWKQCVVHFKYLAKDMCGSEIQDWFYNHEKHLPKLGAMMIIQYHQRGPEYAWARASGPWSQWRVKRDAG